MDLVRLRILLVQDRVSRILLSMVHMMNRLAKGREIHSRLETLVAAKRCFLLLMGLDRRIQHCSRLGYHSRP